MSKFDTDAFTASDNIRNLISELNLDGTFDVSVLPGWEIVIRRTVERIAEVRDRKDIKNLKIVQIKEKFGGLRIYMNDVDDDVDEIIREAEDECSELCSWCAKPGKLINRHGWILNLCDECDEEIPA